MTLTDLIDTLTAAAEDLRDAGADPAETEVLLTQDSDTWGTLSALGAVITWDGRAYLIDGPQAEDPYLPGAVIEEGVVH